MTKKAGPAAALFAAVLLTAACGIEDYPYLYPIPSGSIETSFVYQAVIRLPNLDINRYYYFRNFTIYYRIYVSDHQTLSIQKSREDLRAINPALETDYFALEPYLSTETRVNASIGTLFRNRNYYPLELAEDSIDAVLDRDSLGKTLTIGFPDNSGSSLRSIPFLNIEDFPVPYDLYRSTGEGRFSPKPDRYFVNSSQLYESSNITAQNNADVQDRAGLSGKRYTYASLYIVCTGLDPATYTPIYSTPSFIGILRLPEP